MSLSKQSKILSRPSSKIPWLGRRPRLPWPRRRILRPRMKEDIKVPTNNMPMKGTVTTVTLLTSSPKS